MEFLNNCIKITQNLIFPQTCCLCFRETESPFCPACLAQLPRPDDPCPRCALAGTGGNVCGHCQSHPPAFDRTVAALDYRPPVNNLIPAMKYRSRLPVLEGLARILADHIQDTTRSHPDLLIPVPLHVSRLVTRGFNQSAEIARILGHRLRIPVTRRAVIKPHRTGSQQGLATRQRRTNIRGAFASVDSLSGQRVALVDDVMTTGATLGELARTVRRAGARHIDCWVIARA